MNVSVSELRRHCHKLLRKVEHTGISLEIARRGRIVAHLHYCESSLASGSEKPWLKLRALGGRLLAAPEESTVHTDDFDALRLRKF
ncbi:MAG: type II toxin-antitoxin system prevent-host-death family antitoxin [Pseudomonadota bacterium]